MNKLLVQNSNKKIKMKRKYGSETSALKINEYGNLD